MALSHSSAARTRWRIAAAPGARTTGYDLGQPACRLELVQTVGCQPGGWDLVRRERERTPLPHAASPLRTRTDDGQPERWGSPEGGNSEPVAPLAASDRT